MTEAQRLPNQLPRPANELDDLVRAWRTPKGWPGRHAPVTGSVLAWGRRQATGANGSSAQWVTWTPLALDRRL